MTSIISFKFINDYLNNLEYINCFEDNLRSKRNFVKDSELCEKIQI